MVVGAEGERVVAAEQSTRIEVLPWDEFLEEGSRLRVEGFRRTEWPNIRRDLGRAYGYTLPDGLEPCWVEPGKAMLWQEQLVNHRVQTGVQQLPDGREQPIMELQTFGQGVYKAVLRPANNASLIVHDFQKGLLIRPPGQVVVEEGTLILVEEPAEPVNYIFRCYRHGSDKRSFETWKGYLRHCQYYIESPEEEPPAEVSALASSFEYYCLLHQTGFQTQAGAARHRTVEMRRASNKKAFHASIEEMQINKKSS
jgi:hypothetical protein